MLRGKLADEGMLNEDICLGTKATTQRSDTWKTKVKSGYYFRIPVAVDEAFFFFSFFSLCGNVCVLLLLTETLLDN